jgi:hypothetical protein
MAKAAAAAMADMVVTRTMVAMDTMRVTAMVKRRKVTVITADILRMRKLATLVMAGMAIMEVMVATMRDTVAMEAMEATRTMEATEAMVVASMQVTATRMVAAVAVTAVK